MPLSLHSELRDSENPVLMEDELRGTQHPDSNLDGLSQPVMFPNLAYNALRKVIAGCKDEECAAFPVLINNMEHMGLEYGWMSYTIALQWTNKHHHYVYIRCNVIKNYDFN